MVDQSTSILPSYPRSAGRRIGMRILRAEPATSIADAPACRGTAAEPHSTGTVRHASLAQPASYPLPWPTQTSARCQALYFLFVVLRMQNGNPMAQPTITI